MTAKIILLNGSRGSRKPAADRLPGLARWQYERVHKGIRYDLEIDSSSATPLECARRIQQEFHL